MSDARTAHVLRPGDDRASGWSRARRRCTLHSCPACGRHAWRADGQSRSTARTLLAALRVRKPGTGGPLAQERAAAAAPGAAAPAAPGRRRGRPPLGAAALLSGFTVHGEQLLSPRAADRSCCASSPGTSARCGTTRSGCRGRAARRSTRPRLRAGGAAAAGLAHVAGPAGPPRRAARAHPRPRLRHPAAGRPAGAAAARRRHRCGLPRRPGLHRRAAVHATVEVDGGVLVLACTHLDLDPAARLDSARRVRAAPARRRARARRRRQRRARLARLGGPGRRCAGVAPGPTFPAAAPRRVLDALFVDPGLTVRSAEVVDTGAASDHRAVRAALTGT